MVSTKSQRQSGPPTPPVAHAIGGALGSSLALLLLYPLERARTEIQASVQKEQQEQQQQPHSHHDKDKETTKDMNVATGLGSTDRQPDDQQDDSSGSESWATCEVHEQSEPLVPPSSRDKKEQSKVIKSRGKQTRRSEFGDDPLAPIAPTDQKETLLDCLVRLYHSKTLYRGVGPVVTTLAASNFVFFYAHEAIKKTLLGSASGAGAGSQRSKAGPGQRQSYAKALLASTLAGVVNVLITNPLWVANLRVVQGQANGRSLLQELRTIQRQQGWPSLWNGTDASLLLVSNPVLQFFVYEQLKKRLTDPASPTVPPLYAFVMGAIAKAVATVLTYPLQLSQVLLRLQDKEQKETATTDNHDDDDDQDDDDQRRRKRRYQSTWDCLVTLYGEQGATALFRGLQAKLLQTVLTSAFTFLSYEQIMGIVRSVLVAEK